MTPPQTPPAPPERKLPILQRADLALWKLPRWARKAIVFPVALGAGLEEAWRWGAGDFRSGWRAIMDHVEERPS